MIRAAAPAKINLCLHITGRRADGCHEIESLVAFASVGDEVALEPGARGLSVEGPFAQRVGGVANLVTQALEALDAPSYGARLTKNLPVAAGIGGGSADAGAVARALVEAHGAPWDLDARLLGLGADVPACYHAQPCWMRGVGEALESLAAFPRVPVLLLWPGVACPTGPVFQAWDGAFAPPMEAAPQGFGDVDMLLTLLTRMENVLEVPARSHVPEVGHVLTVLRESGAGLARMSGSGACCFGLFRDEQELQNASDRISKNHPGWWARATHLLPAE